MIAVDSTIGEMFGFTSESFRPDCSWLWKQRDSIILSMVWVVKPNQGYTQSLIREIREHGYTVKIPTPLGTMNAIIKKMGFVRKDEMTEQGPCEVWVLNDKDGEK